METYFEDAQVDLGLESTKKKRKTKRKRKTKMTLFLVVDVLIEQQ